MALPAKRTALAVDAEALAPASVVAVIKAVVSAGGPSGPLGPVAPREPSLPRGPVGPTGPIGPVIESPFCRTRFKIGLRCSISFDEYVIEADD